MPLGPWDVPLARQRRLRIDKPLVMGILNVTPDSFSDGGRLADAKSVAEAARRMVAAGAHILDVGGESTRPGAIAVDAETELQRVIPAVAAIRRALPDAVISIDTRKAAVADGALQAGGDFVNDVSALGDSAMAGVVIRHGCAIVLMRNASLARDAIVDSARSQLAEHLLQARRAGIPEEAILLDPGLGFGDPPGGDVAANLALLGAASSLGLGRPVLVGASRKRFIGKITGVERAEERVAGSVAAAILAVQSGAAIVRVHDVAETAQALRVVQA